ncbi:MAG: septal ring lytic transglycosylase RlpA family protein, partial [Acidobacteriota bacterium]|nr:septal ring lytic transglycosylase RlpA family protein [Acidobacteriota bacterium]
MISSWLAGCSARRPAEGPDRKVVDRGIASWYGGKFHGRRTANGEVYDMNALTAAHKTLPFGSVVEVVNLDNGRSVTVRINDRGPFVRGRVIDLSRAAAKKMGLIGPGVAKVEVVLITPPQPDHYALQAGAFRDATR